MLSADGEAIRVLGGRRDLMGGGRADLYQGFIVVGSLGNQGHIVSGNILIIAI